MDAVNSFMRMNGIAFDDKFIVFVLIDAAVSVFFWFNITRAFSNRSLIVSFREVTKKTVVKL